MLLVMLFLNFVFRIFFQVLQAVDLLVQPGSASERCYFCVTSCMDHLRLPHVTLPQHRLPAPEPPLRLPSLGAAGWHPAGNRLPGCPTHERASPQCLLDPHVAFTGW